jgi:hypothetical protein
MIALGRRVARLERHFAPDADDTLGLGTLSDDELVQCIQLLKASIEGGDTAAAVAQLDPTTADKITLILERAGQDDRWAAFERSQGEPA